MNSVHLIGNLVKAPERVTKDVVRFSIALNRKDKEGHQKADFFQIIVFGKMAELCEKYLSKGNKVGITGHLNQNIYEKDGKKVYTVNITADRVDFLTPKGSGSEHAVEIEGFEPAPSAESFEDVPVEQAPQKAATPMSDDEFEDVF